MFADRRAAGRLLAARLRHLDRYDPIVFGVARGGVPVAYEVASALGARWDVLVVRALRVPSRPDLALGAADEGDVVTLRHSAIRAGGLSRQDVAAIRDEGVAEVARQVRRYHGDRTRPSVAGYTAVLVDDVVTTGTTMRAACRLLRVRGAARVMLAAPVVTSGTLRSLRFQADRVLWLASPDEVDVRSWYEDPRRTSDDEIDALLTAAAR